MADVATVFAIYRFRSEVTDATIADLLRRHREVLVKGDLVTAALPTVVRSLHPSNEHRDFIEIFEWKNEAAPAIAHKDPALMKLWGEFSTLMKVPQVALGQLAEASHPFAHFARFTVNYGANGATNGATTMMAKKTTTMAPTTAAIPTPAKMPTRTTATKKAAPTMKAKRPTPKAKPTMKPAPKAKAKAKKTMSRR